jgi:magnesium-transporting ATPase (P-type)
MLTPSTIAPRPLLTVVGDGYRLGAQGFSRLVPLLIAVQLLDQALMLVLIDPGADAEAFQWSQFGLVMLIAATLSAFCTSVVLQNLHALQRGTDPGITCALRSAPHHTVLLVAQTLLIWIALALAFILLILPSLILAVGLMVAPVALVIGGRGPLAAMNHSWRLVWDRWWRTLGVMVIAALPILLVYLAVYSAERAVWDCRGFFDVECPDPSGRYEAILLALLFGGYAPFGLGVLLHLYQDLEARVALLGAQQD